MLLLLAAVPAVVAGYVASTRRRSRRTAELAAQGLVTTPSTPPLRRRRHLPFGLFASALTVLVLSLGRPEMNLGTTHRSGTVVLAFDVSNSMRADDLEPTRLEAAKTAARAFVAKQPSTIRIGIVSFGDGAVVALPPTNTRADVTAAIDRLSPGGGTSLGQGMFAALSAIAGKPLTIDESALASESGEVDIGFFGSAVIVLLSDGENTDGPDPIAVAEIASVAGVHIHPIGIGTEGGTVVAIDGFRVATALDGDLLAEIASVTDGRYYEAADSATLTEIYENIDLELKTETEGTEITAIFTAVGSLLLVLAASLSLLWFGRVV
jgi:Ca-activated chloride channel family protein